MKSKPYSKCLVWLRNDLRTFDHLPFERALCQSTKVAALYIDDPQDPWRPGAANRWWLHHALKDLEEQLRVKNIPLLFMKGISHECLEKALSITHAESLFYHSCVEPYARKQEKLLQKNLRGTCSIEAIALDLLHDPQAIHPGKSPFYQVFTPFFKRLQTLEIAPPKGEIEAADIPWQLEKELSLDLLEFLPKLPWDTNFYTQWDPTQKGGWKQARQWINRGLQHYEQTRDRPDQEGVSKLSPYLHFGQLSSRQLVFAAQKQLGLSHPLMHSYTRQIAWREFAHHLLWHCPNTPTQPLRPSFENFAWRRSSKDLLAWKKGLTGYPLVDAAMRQLWQTGWMHNRLRMLVGSFLVKDLLIDWKEGASWFWDTLLDADLANNTFGWQWIAGCGADAAPYFRIFNPETQSQKFDPEGHFIRQFIPELQRAKTAWLHAPWKFENELHQVGITLGTDYPKPIVNHSTAREIALHTYEQIKETNV